MQLITSRADALNSPRTISADQALIDEEKSDPRDGGKVSRILEGATVGTVVIISPSEGPTES